MLLNAKNVAVALVLALLTATGSASAQEQSAEAAPAKPAPVSSLHAVFLGGASASTLFGVGSAAGHGGVGLVAGRPGSVRVAILADGDFGSTFGGLPVKALTLSSLALFVVGPVRLGIGPELTYLTLSRTPTSTLDPINGLGIGLTGFVSADLWRSEQDAAVFVALRPQISWLHNADDPLTLTHYASLVTGAFLVGVRY